MDFKGITIPGTESEPGALATESMLRDIGRPKSSDVYESISDKALDSVKEYLRNRDYSEDIERAIDQLFLDPKIFSLTDFRIHLSELTGDAYTQCGENDDASALEEVGITVIEDDYSTLAKKLEAMLQEAADELVEDIATDPDLLRVIDLGALGPEDKEMLASDSFCDVLISRVEDMLMVRISSLYIEELNITRKDVIDYGVETALAMNKDPESRFNGELTMAKVLANYDLLSSADLEDMVRFGLLYDPLQADEGIDK